MYFIFSHSYRHLSAAAKKLNTTSHHCFVSPVFVVLKTLAWLKHRASSIWTFYFSIEKKLKNLPNELVSSLCFQLRFIIHLRILKFPESSSQMLLVVHTGYFCFSIFLSRYDEFNHPNGAFCIFFNSVDRNEVENIIWNWSFPISIRFQISLNQITFRSCFRWNLSSLQFPVTKILSNSWISFIQICNLIKIRVREKSDFIPETAAHQINAHYCIWSSTRHLYIEYERVYCISLFISNLSFPSYWIYDVREQLRFAPDSVIELNYEPFKWKKCEQKYENIALCTIHGEKNEI